ncbi:UNVERIFIED_CONTAM: Plastidic ATP/ADP-transporter [Sesamum latifolium]|uniref:ADP,ATP carrier protein n=1 Tax=Sesamum latifolium TaxID=2727402 RepID=A0AAW2UH97_9LAMI
MGDFSTATGIATFTMMLLSQWIFNKLRVGNSSKNHADRLASDRSRLLLPDSVWRPSCSRSCQVWDDSTFSCRLRGSNAEHFRQEPSTAYLIRARNGLTFLWDERHQGKAAIDVVCNPLGKSGGALIQQFMILTFGSLANSTPYLGGILLVIVLAWLGAAKSLDGQFTALRQEEELEKEMERAAVKIPVVSPNETGNGSLADGPTLNPTGGDSSSGASTPRV